MIQRETLLYYILVILITGAGKKTDAGDVYDEVYFMSYEASSLRMSTTVYYMDTPTEVVKSDVNTGVNEALKAPAALRFRTTMSTWCKKHEVLYESALQTTFHPSSPDAADASFSFRPCGGGG